MLPTAFPPACICGGRHPGCSSGAQQQRMLAECSCARAAQPPSADTPRASIDSACGSVFSRDRAHALPLGAPHRHPPHHKLPLWLGPRFMWSQPTLELLGFQVRVLPGDARNPRRGERLQQSPTPPLPTPPPPPSPPPPTPPRRVNHTLSAGRQGGRPIFVYTR